MEQNTCLRHVDVKECPIGALGFALFYRWRIRGDPFPNFSRASLWYDLYLLPHGNDSTMMTSSKRFLLLLENLCIIILQDAAVLVREPLNALFQHPLFQTATFKEYTIKLHAAIELRGPEQRGALQQCIPTHQLFLA